MKIVEIPSFFTPYGGEFCLEQSKTLKALGHDVSIIANVQLSIRRSLYKYLFTPYNRRNMVVDGIPVYRSDMRGLPRSVKFNVNHWVSIVRQMFREHVKRYGKPDIIHAHCVKWAGFAASLISKEFNIPFVITEHLPSMILKEEFGDDITNVWQIPLLKQAYKEADIVIPVAAELVDDIEQYFGRDYRWTSISNTIDVDFFHYQPRTPLNGRNFRFCCLALYIPRKGYDILFQAFNKLVKTNPDVELHIAGRYTDFPECQSVVNALPCADKIIIHGELNKNGVRDVLYNSDCLILPSRSEAQPLVLLEAMSTGIPVISTECAPKSLRIEGGCTIVPIDGINQMTTAMSDIIAATADPATDFDGKLLSSKVAALASPQAVGKRLSALFEDIISSFAS
ncbi:MAG: glycosyltransferase [Prevotella sp.]|nr:glycosyltransferase [Prevotella sp.]